MPEMDIRETTPRSQGPKASFLYYFVVPKHQGLRVRIEEGLRMGFVERAATWYCAESAQSFQASA
jgi:hypothetical protein